MMLSDNVPTDPFGSIPQLKLQGTRAMFFDGLHEYPGDDVSANDVTTFISRWVVAF